MLVFLSFFWQFNMPNVCESNQKTTPLFSTTFLSILHICPVCGINTWWKGEQVYSELRRKGSPRASNMLAVLPGLWFLHMIGLAADVFFLNKYKRLFKKWICFTLWKNQHLVSVPMKTWGFPACTGDHMKFQCYKRNKAVLETCWNKSTLCTSYLFSWLVE